jgi:hypothetical protein
MVMEQILGGHCIFSSALMMLEFADMDFEPTTGFSSIVDHALLPVSVGLVSVFLLNNGSQSPRDDPGVFFLSFW